MPPKRMAMIPMLTMRSMRLVPRREGISMALFDPLRYGIDRGDNRERDEAYEKAHHHKHEGFHERSERVELGVYFFVVVLRKIFQIFLQVARALADPHHAVDERREKFLFVRKINAQ